MYKIYEELNAGNKTKTKFWKVKMKISSYPSVLTSDLGGQKNGLIEMVFLKN